MGQGNSDRVSHDVDTKANIFRDDQLRQILDDLGEEDTGKGFSTVAYLGATPFVDLITTWNSPAMTKKRSEVQFTYSPLPFVTTIVKTIFNEHDGTTAVATITATITYNANKTTNTVDVVTVRL